MTIDKNVRELLRIAAGKPKSITDAFDALMLHMAETDYGPNDKVYRLLTRLKHVLELDGYAFASDSPKGTPQAKMPPVPGKPKTPVHVVANGTMCTLGVGSPPKGLDIDATLKLKSLLRSTQCYQFEFCPVHEDNKRKGGDNVVLPKGVTWAKLATMGLTMEMVTDKNGSVLFEVFRLDGHTAYTPDRKSFFMTNKSASKHWLSSLDCLIHECVEGKTHKQAGLIDNLKGMLTDPLEKNPSYERAAMIKAIAAKVAPQLEILGFEPTSLGLLKLMQADKMMELAPWLHASHEPLSLPDDVAKKLVRTFREKFGLAKATIGDVAALWRLSHRPRGEANKPMPGEHLLRRPQTDNDETKPMRQPEMS